jgi:hypothetical protein
LPHRAAREAGFISERFLNVFVGGGLLAIVAYGFISWKASGDAFPADMRGSTLEIRARGELSAGSLSSGSREDALGRSAVKRLAERLGARTRWMQLPPADLLRKLEADSLDVLAGYDASLPGADAFGLTRPYARTGRSERVLAVPPGENKLLGLADEAVRSISRRGNRAASARGGPAGAERP